MALLWAAFFIWFAVSIADMSKPPDNRLSNEAGVTDATGSPVAGDNVRQFADVMSR